MEWYQSLVARAPPVESCAQPATVIESYLYPFRTGRVAAQIGHTAVPGLTVTVAVKMNRFPYHSHSHLGQACVYGCAASRIYSGANLSCERRLQARHTHEVDAVAVTAVGQVVAEVCRIHRDGLTWARFSNPLSVSRSA